MGASQDDKHILAIGDRGDAQLRAIAPPNRAAAPPLTSQLISDLGSLYKTLMIGSHYSTASPSRRT